MFDLKVYRRMLISAWKTFGIRRTLAPAGLALLSLFTHATLLLDRVFFPGYRKVEIKNPIFIIGHPRSGTTFFHRLLTQTDEFSVFKLWHIIVPSLTARAVLKPFISTLGALFRKDFKDGSSILGAGHDTDGDSVEEEEMLLFHKLDTQFATLFTPLAFDEMDHTNLVYSDDQPEERRRSSTRFLRECLQRQLYFTGKRQLIAKMPFSTLRIKSLMAEFPDAKFIYLARSPYKTIPSHLSLHRSYFEQRWGLENIPKEGLERYFRRRYEWNVALYRYFHELHTSGQLPADRVKIISYDLFLSDLENAFDELADFTGMQVSDILRQKIRSQKTRQQTWSRGHQNLDLEQFGISADQIAKDLEFVFDTFGFDRGDNVRKVA